MTIDLRAVQFDAQGLVPVVAQDIVSGDVLLIAFMNAEALARTLATDEAYFWSRSRGKLWHKGESSGHTLSVEQVLINCEQNSLLLRVRLNGPGSCHEGYRACYYRQLGPDGTLTTIAERVFDPEVVYGNADSKVNALPLSTPENGESLRRQEASPASGAGDTGAGGWGQELATALRALYAGYLRLRDEDFTATSNTSRMLHDATVTAEDLLARAREELGELQGVIDGTHRHSGTRDDILLEASQVIYWLCLAAARAGLTYAEWQPDVALARGGGPHPPAPSPFAMARGSDTRGEMERILSQVAALLAQTDVAPIEPVRRDLASLRERLKEESK